jgi:hypothetical protein
MATLRDIYPDLPSLLDAIRKRPGMFLGHKTIFGLSLLLMGIQFAEEYHDVPETTRFKGFDLPGFERWVESKYNPRRLSHNSRNLAEYLAGDEAGFDMWFSWYDEFRSEGGRDPAE